MELGIIAGTWKIFEDEFDRLLAYRVLSIDFALGILGQLSIRTIKVSDQERCIVAELHPSDGLGNHLSQPIAWSYQRSNSCGTFPPFSDSFISTCLCSQTFIAAESFGSPV